ncbi:MAG TPA: (2Fe-2S) ferredoxin domain-containing protein [Anaeromyxobacteraceae bacterium]|nr:(2Fe-2S) ferredoxin domain-containing protein [Anaeromyxobacteraceae bacterium]
MRFERHVFVCENRRPEGDRRGCCAARGGLALREALKAEVKRRGLQSRVRVNAAGCLDACEHGPALVVYPEGVWYGPVSAADVLEIVDSHLVSGRPVERLRIRAYGAPSATT